MKSTVDDRAALELDDQVDRDELRQRYYGLLQEERVLLPGVQILVAFLLTVPFDSAFRQLDTLGRNLFGLSLSCSIVALIAFVAPTAFHRMGPRQSRAERLAWSIRLCRFGLAFLGASLTSALAVVARDVFGGPTAVLAVTSCLVLIVGLWAVLPRLAGRPHSPDESRSLPPG